MQWVNSYCSSKDLLPLHNSVTMYIGMTYNYLPSYLVIVNLLSDQKSPVFVVLFFFLGGGGGGGGGDGFDSHSSEAYV